MTRVFLRPKAVAGLQAAPQKDQLQIKAVIDSLERGVFPLHTKKLAGSPDGYRTRVGRWRILFLLKNGEIDVADIFLKKEEGDYRRKRKQSKK